MTITKSFTTATYSGYPALPVPRFDALCKACFDIRAVLAHLLAHIVTGVADALLEIDLCIIVKRFIEDEIGAKARLDDLHDHAVLLELARITLGI